MLAQGSLPVNAAYFTNLTNSINAAGSCAELQALIDEAFASLGAVKAAINAELAQLQPILALLTGPSANLGAIVTWITDYITHVLTPQIKPTITYVSQLTEIATQITDLIAAIHAAESKLHLCTISIPSI